MLNFQAALPTVVHTLYVFSEHQTVIDSYLLRIFLFFGVTDPVRLFRSVILRQIMGIEYQSHYRQFYPEISSYFSSCCSLYGADIIMEYVGKTTNSMALWKLALIQASMIRIRCPHLLCSGAVRFGSRKQIFMCFSLCPLCLCVRYRRDMLKLLSRTPAVRPGAVWFGSRTQIFMCFSLCPLCLCVR